MILIGDANLYWADIVVLENMGSFDGKSELSGPWQWIRLEHLPTPISHLSDFDIRSWPYMRKRHGNRWNIAFCDGHVENLPPAKLFDCRSDAIVRRWNRDNNPHREDLGGWR
jgi:prepilin-type processing-associated H-X9-DG protein